MEEISRVKNNVKHNLKTLINPNQRLKGESNSYTLRGYIQQRVLGDLC